jgi:26S proteasome regulatory subunit N1
VPKPLKFLRPHYKAVTEFYDAMMDGAELKPKLADVLSCLAMTMAEEGSRASLKYKLVGSDDPVGSWGHEYVRNLAGELGAEYTERGSPARDQCADLMGLVDQIVPFDIEHNAEPEACDLVRAARPPTLPHLRQPLPASPARCPPPLPTHTHQPTARAPW